MTIPPVFRKSNENIVTSYNYLDLAAGAGIVEYNLLKTYDGYILSPYKLISEDIETLVIVENSAPAELKETFNFDLTPYNLPQTIEGTALLDIGVSAVGNLGAGRNAYIIAKIQKYDGASATTLAQITTRNYVTTAVAESLVYEIPVPKSQFKKGENLRLSLEVWGNMQTSGGGYTHRIGIDPLNRDGPVLKPSTDDTVLTRARLFIPYDIPL